MKVESQCMQQLVLKLRICSVLCKDTIGIKYGVDKIFFVLMYLSGLQVLHVHKSGMDACMHLTDKHTDQFCGICSEISQKSAMLFTSQANLWLFQPPDTHKCLWYTVWIHSGLHLKPRVQPARRQQTYLHGQRSMERDDTYLQL